MDARLQRRVQRYGWDKAVERYEVGWSRQLAPAQELMLELAALRPGERVLDVACGTGLVTFRAAEAVGPDGRVLGTDISAGMVERARVEAPARGLDRVRFERRDAEALEVPDATFDVALCGLGLMYFPDPVAALREMRRALVPGGRAATAVWGARDRCGWAEIFPIVDRRVHSEVCPMFFLLGAGNSLRWAYEHAGFAEVEVRRVATLLKYGDDDEALDAAFAGGPVALPYSRFDDATRESAHAEYLESIARFRHAGGYAIPGEFVVALGR